MGGKYKNNNNSLFIEINYFLIKVVHGTDDDTLVMDDKSERKINLMTFAEIQKGYTITGGEKVPLLSEILDLCKDKVHVNIEIKGRE